MDSKTTPIFVKEISANVKGSIENVELGYRTLIVGSNGTGKSAITNALELAVSGAASDVAGRTTLALPIELMSLANDGDKKLWADATLSNGEIAQFAVTGTTAKASKPVRTHPMSLGVDCLPLRDVKEAILGSADKARRFFVRWAVGDVGIEEVKNRVPMLHRKRFVDYADSQADGNALRILLEAQTYAGKQKRSAAADAKAAQKLIDDIGEGLGKNPIQSDVAAKRIELAIARTAYEGLRAKIMNDAEDQRRAAQNKTLARHIAHTAKQLQQVKEYGATLAPITFIDPPAPTAHGKVKLALAEVLQFNVRGNFDDCLSCGTAVGKELIRSRFDELAKALSAEIETHQAYQAAQQNADWLQQEHKMVATHIAQFELELKRDQTALKETVKTPADMENLAAKIFDAENKVHAFDQELARLLEARTGWENLAGAQARCTASSTEAREWKEFEKACSQVVKALMDTGVNSFIEKVNAYLPAGDVFGMSLRDGTREVLRLGLAAKGGKIHSALSGAEWTRVTAAIAAACIDHDNDQTLKVIIPEDRAWDAKTLGATMKAFAKIPAQVIIASTVRPAGKLPKGWTLIEMGKQEKVQKPKTTKKRKSVDEFVNGDSSNGKPAKLDLPPLVLQ